MSLACGGYARISVSVPSPVPTQSRKCHACHAKCKSIAPSARPATQSDGPCQKVPRLPHQVPGLPRKVKVHVRKCHACHAKSAATSRRRVWWFRSKFRGRFQARFRGKVPESILVEVTGQAPGKVLEDWGLDMHVLGQVAGKLTEGPVVVTSSCASLEWNCCRLQRSGSRRFSAGSQKHVLAAPKRM